MDPRITITWEYNGSTHDEEVNPKQRIRGGWQKALAKFGISPEDGSRLRLFVNGNEISLDQSFETPGIQEGALLRIAPSQQRSGHA